MNRTHFAVAVIATSAITASAASALTSSSIAGATAAATTETAVGTEVLNLMCAAAGGTSYWTPYTIARCQGVAARSGVDIERLVCEGLLGGQFSWSASAVRRNHVNWAYVSGAPSA